MIRQKLQNFVCKYFGAGGEMGVIEGSVHKQGARIVIRHAVKFIPNRRMLWKDAMASLGTSTFHWFHVKRGGDVEIASWAVHKYMVRICYKFNDDSEKGR